jgi:putative lipoprotein
MFMNSKKIARLAFGLTLAAASFAAAAQQFLPSPPIPPVLEGQQAPAEPKISKGLMLTHEGRFFMTPCRDRSYLNVEDVSADQAVLGALKAFGLAPGRNLYVELLAVQRGGLLEVSGVNFVRTTARCLGETENAEVWRAVGLQSDWEAVAGGGTLLIQGVGDAEIRAMYSAIEHDGERQRIAGAGATLEVEPGICTLADASTMTGWKASLRLRGGEVLQGCAWER